MPNILTKKIGPFPVGVYAAAGIGAVGLGLYLRKKGQGNTVPDAEPTIEGVQEEFPFSFEGPPTPPPPVVIVQPITQPNIGGDSQPPTQPPTGQRPAGNTGSIVGSPYHLVRKWIEGKDRPTATIPRFLNWYNKEYGTRFTEKQLKTYSHTKNYGGKVPV